VVAKYDKEQSYTAKLNERRRRESALERAAEIQQEFLLQQIDELAADFVDHPEQIGHYIADLEAAGMLRPADKGMLFRRLWETMGPAFADRAFNMTERAVFESDALARAIADDAAAAKQGAFDADRAARTVAPERAEALDHASSVLLALSNALGLDLDLGPMPAVRDAQDRIADPDAERAQKTRELLDVLGPQLEVDTDRLEVKVDEEARYRTETQGLYGLMADGVVFLNPEVYDPETAMGRGLLAHEVSHIAQRDNALRGAVDVDPSIALAESEADNISEMFAQGGPVEAPLASLAMYDKAACAPQSQPKEPETPKEPTTEVIVEPPVYEIIEDEIKVPEIQFPFDEPGRGMQGKTAIDAPGYAESNHPALRGLIQTVATFPEITGISITSHTDHRGSNAYNMALSDRRAKATREWLGSPSDGGPGLTVKITSAVGKGETQPKNPSQFADGRDLTAAQHRENRRSEFRITEVNGQAHSGPFKPTKKILVQPGRMIIRYLDADGKVIKEEVVGEGQNPVGLTPEEQAAAGGATQGGSATSQAQTGGGPAAEAPAVQSQPSQTGQTQQAVPQTTSQSAAPKAKGGTVYSQRDRVNRRKKVKVPYRYATPSILGSVGQPGMQGAWQAKAAPGGLTSGQIDQRTRGTGGEPLSDDLRTRFESAFGHDFSDVRIHRGSAAASSVGATAFARGTDIHFAPGRFDAASQSGLDVLGHELTHIVQQRAGRVAVPQNKGLNVNIDRALESEADLLGARAARGERVQVGGSAAGLLRHQDTIQYDGGAGAAPAAETAEAPPTECELEFAGQKFTARAPGGITPGLVRLDFTGAEVHGVRLGGAQIEFDQNSKVLRGSINASVSIGQYVEANDITLAVERREERGEIKGFVSADIRGARLNLSELFETTIDLHIDGRGVSGRAQVDANAPITLGGGITLTSGALTVSLQTDGSIGATGTLVGEVAGLGTVTITATGLSEGHLSGDIAVTLANPLELPGVEGVTLERLNLGGSYTHGQSWNVRGGVGLNIRNWVGADIQGSYTHPLGEEGGAGGESAAAAWQIQGTLTQLQPYTVGEGDNAVTMQNGTLDLLFQNGAFVRTEAGVDYETLNWRGHVGGTYRVQEQELDATGTIEMKVESLPLGDTGGRVTRVNGQVTMEKNELKQLTGAVTAIFPYEEQDTFEVTGEGLTVNVPEMKASGSIGVRTMRELTFGDQAAYNAKVAENASATLTIADNALQGITGGLAFSVAYGQEPVGEGTVDVTFEGPTNNLNAMATFTLTAEPGFGVPDRVNGPVMLKPGGTFVLSIENSALALAQVTGLEYEVKQVGEGATGVFAGQMAGTYDFRTGKLNASGDGALTAPWPLAPNEGVNLTFKEGGNLSVVVTENVLTQVQGTFPFDASIDAREKIPQIVLEGEVSGDYSQETGLFNGNLSAKLTQAVPIPMGGEGNVLTVKENAQFSATVSNSVPGLLQVSFDADYERAGELFLQGHVDNASYNFGTGDFDFTGSLTLKKDIEKQTEDGKWKLIVKDGATVGVEVAKSNLEAITGQIPFEVHDTEGCLLKGNLNDARLEVAELKFSGALDVQLGRDLQYPRSEEGAEKAPEGNPPVSIVAKKDISHIGGRIEKNVFQDITGELQFGVNLGGEEYGAGTITGTWDMVGNRFSGGGDITLVKDLLIGGAERDQSGSIIESWILGFAQGQGLSILMVNNVLDAADVNLNCKLFHNFEEVANGSITGRYKLGETDTFVGNAQVNVIKDLDFSEGERFHYWIEKDTAANVDFAGTTVTQASGDFRLLMKENEQDAVRVTFNGAYAPGSGFNAQGSITALNDLRMSEGSEYSFWVAKDSTGNAAVSGMQVTSFNGNLTLLVKKGEQDFAKGEFTLDYQLADANPLVTAAGSVALLDRVEVASASDWTFFVLPSTGVEFSVTTNNLDYIRGQIQAEAEYKSTPAVRGTLNVEYLAGASPVFNADGSAEVIAPLDLGAVKDAYTFKLMPGTGASFDVKNSELKTVGGTINVQVDDTTGALIGVSLNGTYTHADRMFDGSGTISLLRSLELGNSPDGAYGFFLDTATATATVSQNALTAVTGQLGGSIKKDGGDFARYDVNGTYTAAPQKDFSGSGSFEIVTPVLVTEFQGWSLYLDAGAGITGSIAAMQLEKLTANIPLSLQKPAGTPVVKAVLAGEYLHGPKVFNGTGTAEVVQSITVAEGVGSSGYSFYVEPGTGASATIAENSLTQLTGTLVVTVADAPSAEAKFLKATAQATYTQENGGTVSANGSLEVTRRKKMVDTAAGFAAFLELGSEATIALTNNNVDSLGGTIAVSVEKPEGTPFAGVALVGQYTEASGFSGVGAAELFAEYKVIDTPIGQETYSLWVMPGTGAMITLASSDITMVGGQVIAMIRDADGPGGNFIEVTAAGVSYNFPEAVFTGGGSAQVLKDKKLASFGQAEELWLAQGTGVNATVSNNVLQQVGGNITLKLKDAGDFYLTCGLEGTFDAAGGTGFTGQGTATITRQKELGRLGSYVFFLDNGTGATAHIEQNKLTRVDGQVPFQVHDEQGVLIRGQAEGTYLTEEKKFSGSGGVYLGRDVEYQIGDIKLVFKEGSGGNGVVTDNELRKLGGTLNVDIHDGDGPMVNVNASGEFDAVQKKILWVEGGAKLLRPISVGGDGDNAILRITTLEGSARVENNELKWIHGKLGFEAPRLLNMKGEVEGGWEATGGKDVFYGSGWVDFTIFDEPAQGRYMKGKADFTYNKDETWNIGGEVDYQLNEMIGGKVRVDVDQTLDPVIGGELRIENVKLVEGRDLFKWGKDFPLLRTTVMAGPVPIDINGGVGIGIALSMLPLTFSTTIGFSGWRPLSAATKVPDFTARADLNTGVRLSAALKPWLGVGIGVSGVASAGLRLQGEVALNVDANINPYAELKGESGVYSGKLGMGVNVVGSGSLGITPQVYATLMNTWTYDLANITYDLGQLFSLDYNFAFPFGDQPAAPEKGGGGAAPPTSAAAQTTKIQGHEQKPAMPAETQGAPRKPGAVKGGPDMNQADTQEEQKQKQEGPMGELMQKIDSIQEWGAKVGAVAKVGGHLISMLTFMVTIPPPFGVAAAGIYLAYQLLSGGLTFEDIVTAAKTLWEIIGMIGQAILSALPPWLVKLWEQIKGKSWDQLLGDLIQNMANWLIDLFPSARKLVQGLADMAKGILSDVARVIRKIINGGFGFDDFIDLCRSIGGRLLTLVAELVGDAVVDAVSDAADAVVDFFTDPPW